MKYAIYDFDGTLLQAQTVPFILDHWKKAGISPALYRQVYRKIIWKYLLVKSKVFGLKYDQFRYWSMGQVGKLFASLPLEKLSLFFDSLYESSKPHLHKKVIKSLQKDKFDGYTTVLLSGNFDVFLERYRPLGFDHILGTALFNTEGKIHSTLHILSAEKKVATLSDKFPDLKWSETKAYSDSYADIGLLTQVKQPICVTPDKKLIEHAKKNQWRIIV